MSFKVRIRDYFQNKSYHQNLDRYIDILENRSEFDKLHLGSCAGIEEFKWLYSICFDRDITQVKHHMYIQGMLVDKWKNRVKHTKRGSCWETTPSMRIGPVCKLLPFLLSDCHDLLNRFIHWHYDEVDISNAWKPVVGITPVVQALLAGDKQTAQSRLKLYALDLGSESNDTYYSNDIPLLQSMIDGDIDSFQTLIQPLCDPSYLKKRKSFEHALIEVIAVEATWLIKAMWILGHEIEIDHPLIPGELMPIRPLDNYTVPYFFLDGYEGELPPNYIKWLEDQKHQPKEVLPDPIPTKTIFDPDTYANLTEQILIESALEKGLIVIGNKDDGWELLREV